MIVERVWRKKNEISYLLVIPVSALSSIYLLVLKNLKRSILIKVTKDQIMSTYCYYLSLNTLIQFILCKELY